MRIAPGTYCALLGVVCLFVSGCGKPLSSEECATLLDRYTEKVIDQTRPSAGQVERRKLIEETREESALDPEFAECSQRVSRRAFECAMAANNADEMERCLL